MTLHPFRVGVLAACIATASAACAPHADIAPDPESAPQSQSQGAAAAARAPTMADSDADLERARAAAQAFSTTLRGTLQAAMAEGGPVAAIEVCSVEAPRIAEAVMADHGVRIGRVAVPDRNRNAGNVAADWTLATLEGFQRAVDGGAEAGAQVAVIREGLPGGVSLRMMRGIATEAGCLTCHGSHLLPEVRDAIAGRYPGDRATGFAIGDLRGALWVEVPASATR